MIISIDEHPQNHQVSYEAFASVSDIDLLKISDANLDDTNNPFLNFSIRDYVFDSRSKDITCNWPFSGKSLQLCLHYGVKNLLPPFESLESLRSNRAVENRLPNYEESVNRFDGVFVTTSSMKSQSHLVENLVHKKSTKSHSSQIMVKKSKSVMKLNSSVELEEITASKVCPVCKTFSSSSNTTLNAHIDRCLSEESSMKKTASTPKITVKHRIKPRKMRLMVDIYKTAARCTIEELDRRNGTSWANNSSFHDQELEHQAQEEKKEEPQEANFVPEVDDHEPVYIDTNGTKVRILSMPNVGKLDDRKLEKRRKGSRVFLEKKKKKAYDQKTRRKILKLCDANNEKANSGQETSVAIEESSKKEDVTENPMKARLETDDLAITRPPWACFKRTGLSKKRFAVLKKSKEVNGSGDGCDDSPSFSSKENLLKANFKRKFSAFKNSRTEEEATCEESSFETLSVLEVENKKSVTSKSSNGDSFEGLEITLESSRSTDVPFHGSFTGLRNSQDDEFLDHDIENIENRMDDDIEKQENYFSVDPIPIPGPPGSFLPLSPGADMVTEEELQNNSSLTNASRAHSSEGHHHLPHDVTNPGFVSDSPISTVSCPDLKGGVTHSRNIASYHQNASVLNEPVLESNTRPNESLSITLPQPESLKSRIHESVGPTTPVLRLMGKNLTVVNTVDHEQFKHPPSPRPGLTCHQQLHNIQTENRISFFYGYPHPQHHVNSSENQLYTMFAPRDGNMDKVKSTNEVIVINDDSSENEGDDRMFKERVMRNHMQQSHSFASYPYNGGFSPVFHHLNDGNLGRWVTSSSTAYYPRTFS